MILTVIRQASSVLPDSIRLTCIDADYATALLIGNKLLLHMAAAYRMIEGDKQQLIPDIKPLDQRKVLFDQLPNEFETKKLLDEAKAQGVPRTTAFRWNEYWLQHGVIEKIQHGWYKKVA